MAKIANVTETRTSSGHAVGGYVLRNAGVMQPKCVVNSAEATLDEVVALFADHNRYMGPALLAFVSEMTDPIRGGFMQYAGQLLNVAYGSTFSHSPMYRAFPNHQDVMIDKGMVDFLLNVGVHTLDSTAAATHGANPVTGAQDDDLGPDAAADEQFSTPVVYAHRTFMPVEIAQDEDVHRLAQTVLSSLLPFTPDDSAFIAACVEDGIIGADDLASVKFREKMPALVGLVPAEVYDAAAISVTDALRLAAHFSDDDVSLTRPVKFRFPKSAGKRVLRLAERVIASGKGSPEDDVVRHEELWKRLVRHVGTQRSAKVAPLLTQMVSDVRAGKITSWNAQVANASPEEAARLMADRPGAFVRGALALSRRFNAEGAEMNREVLLTYAEEAFATAPALPLLQLHKVLDRTVRHSRRFHVMKNGNVLTSKRDPEDHEDLLMVVENALHARLPGLVPWSRAENAENRFVPIGGRSASVASDGAVRGDTVALSNPDGEVVRLFLHWKDPSDVDLSAIFFDGDGNKMNHCSFTTLNIYGRNNTPIATHSGDIRDGRKGAAEYVDVNIALAKAAGMKKVMLMVNVYHGKPFAEFPTHVGAMMRDGRTGRHFEIGTIETAMRVTSNATMCTCALFDLDTLRMTYVDMPASWGHAIGVETGIDTLKDHMAFIANYGDYRVSMADVLHFAGTPDGPVLSEKDLVKQRSSILAALSDAPDGPDVRATRHFNSYDM